MNLFIDTNIFLSFYHLTSEDLEELRKLYKLMENKKISFFLTQQVIDEFRRNREAKIEDAFSTFKKQKLNINFPAFCKDYPEYETLRNLQKDFSETHSGLISKIEEHIREKSLKADEIIESLFNQSSPIDTEEFLLDRALSRVDKGNPPGKDKDKGDSINWEALLENVPYGEDLYLIADDRDYFSAIDSDSFKEFLDIEWKNKKGSNIKFYRGLSSFFKENYPGIKLASEIEKTTWVYNLISSGSFANTHKAIKKLNEYQDFSESQVNEMLEASLQNSQIRMILGDPDVYAFIKNLVNQFSFEINSDLYNQITAHLQQHEPPPFFLDDFDDPPPF